MPLVRLLKLVEDVNEVLEERGLHCHALGVSLANETYLSRIYAKI